MDVQRFMRESNRIEGILREPNHAEIEATRRFVFGPKPTLLALIALASEYTNGHGFLRERVGMDVRVGSHVAPRGGPAIARQLEELLATIEDADPFEFHAAYETLHPFMDGNGRTGRALWAWQMGREDRQWLDLGFLHSWYYQSLQGSRGFTAGQPTERAAVVAYIEKLAEQDVTSSDGKVALLILVDHLKAGKHLAETEEAGHPVL